MSFSLLHLDPETGEVRRTPLEPGSRAQPTELVLRGLPGGRSVQVVVEEAGAGVVLRVELELDATERGTLRLWREGSSLRYESRRPTVQLPVDPRHAAPPPHVHTGEDTRIDLLFLVDLTTRVAKEVERPKQPEPVTQDHPTEGAGKDGEDAEKAKEETEYHVELWLLLGDTASWRAHVAQLAAFAESLAADGVDLRTGVIGFSDTRPRRASAADLIPTVPAVVPELARQRELVPFDPADLQRRLGALPPTTGADFVDAVADGLAAARSLPWREDARRLVLLLGDSPGYSITRPAPRGADVQIRPLDVDTEALRLARERDVELLTLFHALPQGLPLRELPHVPPFLAHAEAQYRGLAAHPDWAWTVAGFVPEEAASSVRRPPRLLARGTSLPVLLEPPE